MDALFGGPGPIRALCRQIDWGATTLGPPQTWPPSLRAAVRICLSAPIPMAVWAGPDLNIIYNEGYPPVLGPGKHPSALGRPGREVWPEFWDRLAPELAGVMEEGRPTRHDNARFVLRRGDREEEACFAYSYTPIFEEDGRVVGALNVFEETTRRELDLAMLAKLTEDLSRLETEDEILRTAGERLAARLSAEGCAVAQVDEARDTAVVRQAWRREGAVDLSGTYRLSEFLSEELLAAALAGKTLVVRDTRTDPRLDAEAYAVLKVGALVTVRSRRDGEWRYNLTVTDARPRDWRADEVELIEEVTSRLVPRLERARAEAALRESRARLEEADRRKSQFLAVLSHELRNPLAPVKNGLYILDRAAPGSDQARRAKAVIDRQVDQLTRLVDDLLDVTRINRGIVQLHRHRRELNELVQHAVEDNRTILEQADLDVRLETAPGPVFIDADANRIAQVISNLLRNAAKFTPAGGRVTVVVSSDPAVGQAVVRVADTGVGIAPEVLAHLFEPFVQADTTLDRRKGGLGLGLTLVEQLVEQHGGSVEASSAGAGRGSELIVRLPLAPAEATSGPPETARPAHSTRRVLVIEDNVDAAESLREVLELGGHEVAVAYDGPGGIARARAFRPDVVLCDIGLPGMDGYEVARVFKADESLRPVHLVAMTGYALPEDKERAAEAGFAHHVAKPPTSEKLEVVLAGASRAGVVR